MMIAMTTSALVNESADSDSVDVEIPHTSGVASSREPTPPSVCIVSMQGSKTALTMPVVVMLSGARDGSDDDDTGKL